MKRITKVVLAFLPFAGSFFAVQRYFLHGVTVGTLTDKRLQK